MSLRVLVTRPREDAAPLAAALRGAGHEVLEQPLLAIEARQHATVDLDGVQALLFTSANGVRAFAALDGRRDLAVCAVGGATARAAREAGFAAVRSADGDVHALAALVRGMCDPAAGRLVHVAGSEVAGDLAGILGNDGFRVDRIVLYAARTATALQPETLAALRSQGVDAALFFSPRTARTFVTLADAAGIATCCRSVDALCLSAAVADALRTLPWRSIRVAARPDQDALLDELTTVARQ